jgi:outer membrane protein OmpA-like peptidoglycan-associated protein
VTRNQDGTVYVAPTGILFDVDSVALRPEAFPTLRGIAADITASHLTGTIRVDGYTDDVGADDDNLTLSEGRAQRVATWLSATAGISSGRITVFAHGEADPVQPNDTEAHRQANRRVVITVRR